MHGTVLTPTGACILCERRVRATPTRSGRMMGWLLGGVVCAAVAVAAGLRIRSALEQRASVGGALPVATVSTVLVPTGDVPIEGPSAMPNAPSPPVDWHVDQPPAAPRVDPNEARREHERLVSQAEHSVQIDLYGEGWCPSCRKAREWLDSSSFSYTYRDTSDAVNKHTMRALNPNSTIPTIDIEGQVIVGFRPQAMRASIRRAAEAHVAKNAASGR